MKCLSCRAAALLWVVVFCGAVNVARGENAWTSAGGESVLHVYPHLLAERGLALRISGQLLMGDSLQKVPFQIDSKSTLAFTESGGRFSAFTGGDVVHVEDLVIESSSGRAVTIPGFAFGVTSRSSSAFFRPTFSDKLSGESLLEMSAAKAGFYYEKVSLEMEGADIRITPKLADLLGDASLAGVSIGDVRMSMPVAWAGGDGPVAYEELIKNDEGNSEVDGAPRGGNGGTICPQPVGPDVITGIISDIGNYGNAEVPTGSGQWYVGFSVGTTSCNIGNFMVLWDDDQPPPTNLHPVIAQNFYRLRTMPNGVTRFEQIGQSWLKHGFTVAAGDSCGCGCTGPGGPQLHPGCSDPYGAGLNGSQSGLGPRWQVNARTGEYPHPYQDGTHVPGDSNTWKRVMVRASDLGTANSLFYAEAQYVAPDDHQAGNASNNASYTRINVTPNGANNYNASNSGFQTVRERPAIRAWKAQVPSVVETDILWSPQAGEPYQNAREYMILAANVTALPGGKWNYEYALYNMHSHRGAWSFAIPVGNSAVLEDVGFTNVMYHSGDGESGVTRSNTAWNWAHQNGLLTWSTQPYNQNPNSNALMWGALYNFRFTCNIAPASEQGEAIIGLFRPGTPTSLNASTVVPEPSAVYIEPTANVPTIVVNACTETSFDVDILDGSDVYAPGSAKVHYSINDGAYNESSMVLVSGTLHRATLPAVECGSTIRYYLSARGQGGETVNLPETAPAATFAPQVGVEEVVAIIDEDFNAGLPGDWTATGLWNITSQCSIAPGCNVSGTYAYFGQTSTCNYDTGAQAIGSLSRSVAIPNTRLATLRYCSNFEREAFAQSDWPRVRVNGTTVDAPATGGLFASPWVQRTVDLTAFAGQTVTLEWFFDSTDPWDNQFRGWQVDNVRLDVVQVSCLAASPAMLGDLDGNGQVDGRDLEEFVVAVMAASSLPQHVCPADFDSSGTVDLDDVAGMVNEVLNRP